MNRIEEKTHPYADEIPQMEIRDTKAVAPGQQKSDSITTHNDSQGSHQCRRDEMFVFSDKVKIKIPYKISSLIYLCRYRENRTPAPEPS